MKSAELEVEYGPGIEWTLRRCSGACQKVVTVPKGARECVECGGDLRPVTKTSRFSRKPVPVPGLEQAMKEADVSVTMLCWHLKLWRLEVYRWVKGLSHPDKETVEAMADVLCCSPERLTA